MKKRELIFVIGSFLTWRIILSIAVVLAVLFLPLQNNFLGGGRELYLRIPQIFSWLNFDGEHYFAIAKEGYKPLTYFFFPLFPVVARLIGNFVGGGITSYAASGLFLNHVFFLASIIGVWKLVTLDYKRNVAIDTILLMLLFPTSFYFASYYTESLFLALCVWAFYFARKDKWLLASVLGMFASVTKIIGVVLFFAFLFEVFKGKRFAPKHLFIGLIPLGLISYMYFLKIQTGDPLNFLNTIEIFGGQRSSSIILLPQVFYRYVFKIIPNIDYSAFPVVFVTFLEFFAGLLFLFLSIFSFFRLRLSYSFFLLLGYLIPTFSGSFSSLPRYVAVLFPAFIVLSLILSKMHKAFKIVIYLLLLSGLIYSTALFARGYWIS